MSISRGLRNAAAASATMLLAATPVGAAPLPPLAPIDVCGTIRSAHWLPPRSLPAVPGMSGSAGHERHWPARLVVVLDQICGVSEPLRVRVNALLTTSHDGAGLRPQPGEIVLVLVGDEAEEMLAGDSLCVTGFTVRGDEGGTWTHHDAIDISDRGCLLDGE